MSNTMAVDIDATDRAILAALADGARTQGYLIDNTNHTRGQIQQRLPILQAGGHIEKIHDPTALYGITEKGEGVPGDE